MPIFSDLKFSEIEKSYNFLEAETERLTLENLLLEAKIERLSKPQFKKQKESLVLEKIIVNTFSQGGKTYTVETLMSGHRPEYTCSRVATRDLANRDSIILNYCNYYPFSVSIEAIFVVGSRRLSYMATEILAADSNYTNYRMTRKRKGDSLPVLNSVKG